MTKDWTQPKGEAPTAELGVQHSLVSIWTVQTYVNLAEELPLTLYGYTLSLNALTVCTHMLH